MTVVAEVLERCQTIYASINIDSTSRIFLFQNVAQKSLYQAATFPSYRSDFSMIQVDRDTGVDFRPRTLANVVIHISYMKMNIQAS